MGMTMKGMMKSKALSSAVANLLASIPAPAQARQVERNTGQRIKPRTAH